MKIFEKSMKGDFAKAYEAGRHAYRKQGSAVPINIFTFLIVAVAVVIVLKGWLPWYLTILLCLVLALAYGFIRGMLLRRKVPSPEG
jgi:ribose/xylose/arabinose/galactoside ABC-type transport system permease subunit